jgi:hypothetical protein
MGPTEFLRKRKIVANNKTDLIIKFDKGNQESLAKLLDDYHQEKMKLLTASDIVSISKNLGESNFSKEGQIKLLKVYGNSLGLYKAVNWMQEKLK